MVGVDQVLEKLSTVIDPDLKKDIVSMGMIKDLELNQGDLKFTLELTTPACPFNAEIEEDVRKVVEDKLNKKIEIRITKSDDIRSYRINSEKIKKILNFEFKYSIKDAVIDICNAFENGSIKDSFNEKFQNIKVLLKENKV